MEFDITKMVEEIAMQAKENQEEFVFETIQPYCENILQMKINKEELKQILLNGIKKQQTSEDCISREALDDAISELTYWHFENDRLMTGGGGTKSETVYKVDDVTRLTHILSPVTPQQTKWIPVSERLPEDYIHVLCQFTLGGMGECYLAHGAFHVVGGLVMTCNEVIAWMPLPEPYNIPAQTFGCAED